MFAVAQNVWRSNPSPVKQIRLLKKVTDHELTAFCILCLKSLNLIATVSREQKWAQILVGKGNKKKEEDRKNILSKNHHKYAYTLYAQNMTGDRRHSCDAIM